MTEGIRVFEVAFSPEGDLRSVSMVDNAGLVFRALSAISGAVRGRIVVFERTPDTSCYCQREPTASETHAVLTCIEAAAGKLPPTPPVTPDVYLPFIARELGIPLG